MTVNKFEIFHLHSNLFKINFKRIKSFVKKKNMITTFGGGSCAQIL